ncbi:MAG: MFS transporter [Caulobacterales bacterium 68-7]|nr:MAG: MFS transporter [Caulobacterales bacterium 68-7]
MKSVQTALARSLGEKYAFVAVGAVFIALVFAAGTRAAPGVMMIPLEQAFGWDRATVSMAAAIGVFLYGLTGPFAGAFMQSLGVRNTVLAALALMAGSIGLSSFMTEPWQYVATWGVLGGVGSGAVAMVLAATVTQRWFVTHRGLVMGAMSAATATGSLIFLPFMAAAAEAGGWRPVVLIGAVALAALIPVMWFLLPEKPSDLGVRPFGAEEDTPPAPPIPTRQVLQATFGALGRAARTRSFWLLFGGFFVCGLTTNGLIGAHMIALCADQGLPETRAAGLLAMMGIFDLIGTTASGWLTDRYDPRKLLFVYYALRGLSLIYLPYSDFSLYSLSIFAVFYGLDWIATVPPTLALTREAFGERDAPIVFGWIMVGHQIGAATAAMGAGLIRVAQGRYLEAFVIAGIAGLAAAGMSIAIRRKAKVALA